jgi:hypothetical protein
MAVTQQQLKALFEYRADGNLVRKVAVRGPVGQVGRVVGYQTKDSSRPDKVYMATKIEGQYYAIHKLIWIWHYGVVPDQIDHINRNSVDNQIENLRLASTCENMSNRKVFSNNTSGCKGVSWHKRISRWFAYVDVRKKRKCLGYFDDLELAELVSTEARDLYHGKYANHA